MIRVVSVQVMRESDAWTIQHKISSKELMYRAGEGIFRQGKWIEPVCIVCGKGNNAGDGFVVASIMKKAGISCEILCLTDTFSEDGKYYFERCLNEGVPWRMWDETIDLTGYGSVLDCIFGTGFKGEPKGIYKEAIEAINHSGAYVVSADINSGLNGDSGTGSVFVKSDLTVSIGDFKYGHFRGLSDIAMKEKVNVDIGIEIQGPCDYVKEI